MYSYHGCCNLRIKSSVALRHFVISSALLNEDASIFDKVFIRESMCSVDGIVVVEHAMFNAKIVFLWFCMTSE